jgi:hypothetical protein
MRGRPVSQSDDFDAGLYWTNTELQAGLSWWAKWPNREIGVSIRCAPTVRCLLRDLINA